MKFVISLTISFQALAAPIHLFHEEDLPQARMIKTILMEDYKIPEELIALQKVRNCEQVRELGKLDLCLKNNGDLIVVSVDRGFVNESLKIFLAP